MRVANLSSQTPNCKDKSLNMALNAFCSDFSSLIQERLSALSTSQGYYEITRLYTYLNAHKYQALLMNY